MNYPVLCYEPACGQEAIYKIAARWSDGVTHELKTYSLCCPACLADHFRSSLERHVKTQLIEGEHLERPGIYQLIGGWRDRNLLRLEDLEKELLSGAAGKS